MLNPHLALLAYNLFEEGKKDLAKQILILALINKI